jgi:DNA-binding MarR family transcriptional regulator
MDALGQRIAASWTEIRRGAATSEVRDYLYGTGEDRLDRGQMDTLDLLARQPLWRMSELAEALRVDPSTATRAVQRLVNVEMAVRRPSDEDGRVVMVEITEAGRARHAVVAERRMVLMNHMLNAFNPSERGVLAEMLERFIAAIDSFLDGLADQDEELSVVT